MNNEKLLKRFIKNKITFTQSMLIAFLITGGVSFSADSFSVKELITSTISELVPTNVTNNQYGSIVSANGSESGAFAINTGDDLFYFKVLDKSGNTLNTSGAGIKTNAVLDSDGKDSYNGNFIGNMAYEAGGFINGGAINLDTSVAYPNNISSIIGDFIGNSATSDTNDSGGGAIFNNGAQIDSIVGNFIGNHANNQGGAISTGMNTIGSIKGDFIGNYISGSDYFAQGGAIFIAFGHVNTITGNFIGNHAITDGGTSQGGAILVDGSASLVAKGQDMEFTGNYVSEDNGVTKVSNAIHVSYGTLNLYAEDDYSIIFNDRITSEVSTINIGGARFDNSGDTGTYNGTVVLNENMNGVEDPVYFNGGTIKIGEKMEIDEVSGYSKFFNNSFYFSGDNLSFDSRNGKVDNFDTTNWVGSDILNAAIDIDVTDTANITGDVFSNLTGQKINITELSFIIDGSVPTLEGEVVTIANGDMSGLTLGTTEARGYTPIYYYSYDVAEDSLSTTGQIIVGLTPEDPPPAPPVPEEPGEPHPEEEEAPTPDNTPGNGAGGYNPNVLKESVGIGSYANNYSTVVDRVLNKEKEGTFGNSVWLDTYGSDEKISYSTDLEGKEFDNSVVITTVGLDHSFDLIPNADDSNSIFFGHLTSNQEFDNIQLDQEGFYLGTSLDISKGNKYMNVTLLGGTGSVEDKNASQDKFDMFSLSAALKFGAEYNFGKNIVVEPSLILGYHSISADGYTNDQNVEISAETTGILNLTPEMKVTGNIKGFKPYTAIAYNFNSHSGGRIEGELDGKVYPLPSVEIESYLEGRVGVSKTFKDNLVNAYVEVIGTSGDKDSFGAQAGFEYKF